MYSFLQILDIVIFVCLGIYVCFRIYDNHRFKQKEAEQHNNIEEMVSNVLDSIHNNCPRFKRIDIDLQVMRIIGEDNIISEYFFLEHNYKVSQLGMQMLSKRILEEYDGIIDVYCIDGERNSWVSHSWKDILHAERCSIYANSGILERNAIEKQKSSIKQC